MYEIGHPQENLSEAKTGILVYLRKRLLTAEYEFKFLVPEKMRIGTLETFSNIVTYTVNAVTSTLLFQLLDCVPHSRHPVQMPREVSV